MHVIQQEPPLDPGNFTDDPDHIAFFQSLVHDPDIGFNARFANLCAPLPIAPNNPSPHINDSRIRFLFDGIPGQDILFHPSNMHYDGGFNHPTFGGNNVNIANTCTAYNDLIETNANLTNDQLNALHILWVQCATFNGSTDCDILGGLGFPDGIDGIPFVGQQGFFTDPLKVVDHNLTRGIAHELAVALGLFHAWANDRCDDTPQGVANASLPNNYMGHHVDPNNPKARCSFTQCQLARMHYILETEYPDILRNTDNCSISEPDIIIPTGEDIFWNSPRRLNSNILIESGAKLTITCDIGMPEGARITVMAGGELVVDGARIFNNCGQWDGIVVIGDVNAGQTSFGGQQQGSIRLNPGSVIEGAYIGVRLFDPANPQNTAGGIISARETTFYNNTGGVAFARYQGTNPFTGNPLGYAATFSSCSFIVDDGIPLGLSSFSYMANLLGVDGVRFLGCTFSNEHSKAAGAFADGRGNGIIAYDAGFSVEGKAIGFTYPPTDYQRAGFNGFATAIYAQNTGKTTNTFRVSRTDFEDNARGIVSSSVHNIFAVGNTFRVGTSLPYQYTTNPFIGIQVLRGTGFTIEENDLEPDLGLVDGTEAVGIVVISSGEEPNEVYKNKLDNLFTGNLANGKNRNLSNPENMEGLQYLCNEHSTNEFDIAVPGVIGFSGNIAEHQGSSGESAGNTFTNPPVQLEGHVSNSFDALEYFFTIGANLEPINNTVPPLVTKAIANDPNGCAFRQFGEKDGIITETDIQQIETDFNGSIARSEKARLANLLIRQALVDTNGINLPEARTWLANKGGLETEFMTVDTWIHEGNTTTAQQVLSNIPNNYALTGEALTEYQLFNQYKGIQISAIQNGLSDEQMFISNQGTVLQIADAGNYYASVQAQGLVNSIQGMVYDPTIILPNSTPPQLLEGSGAQADSGTTAMSLLQSYLAAQPNPTTGQTTFMYRLPDGMESGTLRVMNIDGKEVTSFSLAQREGRQLWNSDNLPEGIYLFSLLVDGKNIHTERISVIK